MLQYKISTYYCNKIAFVTSRCFFILTLFMLNSIAQGQVRSIPSDSTQGPEPDTLLAPISILGSQKTHTITTYFRWKNPNSGFKSLGTAIENMIGMEALQTGGRIAKPSWFGFTGLRLVILKNDLRLEGQQWGLDHAPEVHPLYAQKIQLLLGSNAVYRASDALGGILQLLPNIDLDTNEVQIGYQGAFQTNGRLIGQNLHLGLRPRKHPQLTLIVMGQYGNAGYLHTAKDLLANTGFSEMAFDTRIKYQWEKTTWHLEYGLMQTTNGIYPGAHASNFQAWQNQVLEHKEPIPTAFDRQIGRPSQVVLHETSCMSIVSPISSSVLMHLRMHRQYNRRQEYDLHVSRVDSIAALNRPALFLHLTDIGANLELEWKKSQHQSYFLTSGIQRITNTFEGRFFIPNYRNNIGFIALQSQHRYTKHQVNFSARWENVRQSIFRNLQNQTIVTTDTYTQPALGLSYHYTPSSSHALSIHLTLSTRGPSINERFAEGLHHGQAVYEKGNASLTNETSRQTVIQHAMLRSGWQIQQQLLIQNIRRFIYQNPTQELVTSIRGTFPVWAYTQSNASMTGYGLRCEKSWFSRLVLEWQGQWNFRTIRSTRQTIPLTPGQQYRTNIRFLICQTNTCKWTLEWGTRLYQKQWRISNEQDYFPTPKNAWVSLTGISAEINTRNWRFEMGLHIDNVLNASYRLYTDRMRYYHDALGRNLQCYLYIPIQKINTHAS
jgi:iron complex outermembrane recepter protein